MWPRKPDSASSIWGFGGGAKEQWPARIAYAIWLVVPAVAFQTAGDTRPVQPWEFQAGRK